MGSRPRAPAGVVLAGGGTGVWVLSAAVGGTTPGRVVALPVIAALVAVASLVAAPLVAACLATVSWACLLGFDESRYGVLSWHAGDGWRLAVLVMVGLASSLHARARHRGASAGPTVGAPVRRPRLPVE